MHMNDSTATDLYLVRLWRERTKDEGAPNLHGKLQHVVSGASCYFDGLSGLPEALEKMLEQKTKSFGPDLGNPPPDGHELRGGEETD